MKKQPRLYIGNLQSFHPYVALQINRVLSSARPSTSPPMARIYYTGDRSPYEVSTKVRTSYRGPASSSPHMRNGYRSTNILLRQLYPPDTKVFLYYFIPPGKPRIAGELRLRVASSDDYASFEGGSDIWLRLLYSVSKYYTPLYEKLKGRRTCSE